MAITTAAIPMPQVYIIFLFDKKTDSTYQVLEFLDIKGSGGGGGGEMSPPCLHCLAD